MKTAYKKQLRELAYANPTEEICGYLYEGKAYPCKNTAAFKTHNFRLTTYAEKKLVSLPNKDELYIYHSHPIGSLEDFSVADIRMLDEKGLNGLLVVNKTGNVLSYKPNEIPPYVNRRWHTAYRNCYTLIKDFYLQEYGIKLNRYYLTSIADSEAPGWNLFEENIREEGFKKVDDIKTGDLVTFKIGRAHHSNHIGVISDAEGNKLLHHPGLSTSEITNYSRNYRRCTTGVYRHEAIN